MEVDSRNGGMCRGRVQSFEMQDMVFRLQVQVLEIQLRVSGIRASEPGVKVHPLCGKQFLGERQPENRIQSSGLRVMRDGLGLESRVWSSEYGFSS